MKKELMVFEQREVLGMEFKIYGTSDEPLFLAKDVANWIEHSKANMMLQSIDEDEKLRETIFTSGQNREMWFLTEDGLYEVLMQSRKPIAKQFKKEVKKILKQIRQTGGYIPIDADMNEDEIMAKALLIAQSTIEKKSKIIKSLQPKAKGYDTFLDTKGDMDFHEFVKSSKISLGRNKFMEKLRDEKILMSDYSRKNIPYQSYIDREYFKVIQVVKGEYSTNKTLVTKKGADWLLKKCSEWGV